MDDSSPEIGLKDRSSYDYSYYYDNFDDIWSFYSLFGSGSSGEVAVIQFGTTCTIICLGLPLTLCAIYGLCSQVKNGEVAPIYVINLLISDLIQFCCMIVEVTQPQDSILFHQNRDTYSVFHIIYNYSLLVSVGLMVCIALERYLLIVHPLWYRCRRTIKTSLKICIPVWIVPVACVLTENLSHVVKIPLIMYSVLFLLPLPLLLFFLVATLKALSASISVPTDEKRRIAVMLIMVLLIYLLLFLPGTILFVYDNIDSYLPHLEKLFHLAPMFLKVSPLADLFLYIILRKGTIRQLSACVCRSRKESDESSAVTV